jgi:hypothetical protein
MDRRLLELLPFPMVRPRRPHSLPNICHPACPERSRRERSEGSAFLPSSSALSSTSLLRKTRLFIDTVPPAALATRHSLLATFPFRIRFFAHPCPLNLIESYSYKKQGRGWSALDIPATQTLRTRATVFCSSPHQYHSMGLTPPLFSYSSTLFCHTENAKAFIFNRFRTLCAKRPGWGCLSFSSARLRALCVSALSFSAPRFSSLSQRLRSQ